jgi:hypothetical protein
MILSQPILAHQVADFAPIAIKAEIQLVDFGKQL